MKFYLEAMEDSMNVSNFPSSAPISQIPHRPMVSASEEQLESPAERVREATKTTTVAQSNLATGQGQKVNVLA